MTSSGRQDSSKAMRMVILGNTPVLNAREMCCSGRLANTKISGSRCRRLAFVRTPSMFRRTLGSVRAFIKTVDNNETRRSWAIEKSCFCQWLKGCYNKRLDSDLNREGFGKDMRLTRFGGAIHPHNKCIQILFPFNPLHDRFKNGQCVFGLHFWGSKRSFGW